MLKRIRAGLNSRRARLFRQESGEDLAFLTLLFALFACFVGAGIGTDLVIRHFGTGVQGAVVDRYSSNRQCSRGSQDVCRHYHITVRYAADAGLQIVSHDVDRPFYLAVEKGDPVEVRYLKPFPSSAILPGSTNPTGPTDFFLVLALISACCATGCFLRWRRTGEMIQLRDHGVRRRATVTSIETGRRVNIGLGGISTVYRVKWSDEAGAAGKSMYGTGWKLPAVGSAISVYADPKGQLASVWGKDCPGLPRRKRE